VYRYAIEMEYATVNPFASVKRKTAPQRKVVWTEDDVRQFLDTAYSQFEWRSLGLIVHMAYEWCQRLGDMRLLTWDNFDFANRKLFLEQSKRRSQVTLPIEDDLYDMLINQEQDFGFQQYVAPRTSPVQGEYHPYSMERLSKAGRAVMREAGLPDELRLMDLRRTGMTQMVEAGVSMGQIMSVTGHSNPQSVKPYMKNTYASANNALTTRKSYGKST
jgi:integrase